MGYPTIFVEYSSQHTPISIPHNAWVTAHYHSFPLLPHTPSPPHAISYIIHPPFLSFSGECVRIFTKRRVDAAPTIADYDLDGVDGMPKVTRHFQLPPAMQRGVQTGTKVGR